MCHDTLVVLDKLQVFVLVGESEEDTVCAFGEQGQLLLAPRRRSQLDHESIAFDCNLPLVPLRRYVRAGVFLERLRRRVDHFSVWRHRDSEQERFTVSADAPPSQTSRRGNGSRHAE